MLFNSLQFLFFFLIVMVIHFAIALIVSDLYLLDLPIPANMDGKMLRGMFEEHWLEAHPIKLLERASERPVSEA